MKYNMLTVENENVGKNRFNKTMWLCRCDCGAPCITQASLVRNGRTKSCGCLQFAGNHRTHGHSAGSGPDGKLRSKAYSTWLNMKTRCDNPNTPQWKDYGGRGITYDPRWVVFENFFADMGEPMSGQSIDRIDNDGGYSKDNCQWANASVQRRNSKRPMVWVDIEGERLILTDAVKKFGVVPFTTAYNRIHAQGWDPVEAITTGYTRAFSHAPNAGVLYTYQGKTQSLSVWAKELGIGRITLLKRLQRGIPADLAFSVKGYLKASKLAPSNPPM